MQNVVPNSLEAELNKKENERISKYFQKLPASHKFEYVKWIENAKKPETKITRIEKTIEMLTKRIGKY